MSTKPLLLARRQVLPFLPALLLSFFYVTHLTASHPGLIAPSDYWRSVKWYLLGTAVLAALLRLLFWRSARLAALGAFLCTGFFMFWGYLMDLTGRIVPLWPVWGGWYMLWILLLLTSALLFLFSRTKQPAQDRLLLFLSLLQVLWISLDLLKMALVAGPADSLQQARTVPRARQVRPWNVYLIVLDEFASSRNLRDNWRIDNSGLDSFLRSRNFSVQSGSRSNYNYTFYSLSSLLNLDYDTVHPGKVLSLDDYAVTFRRVDHNVVVKAYEGAGFTFENNSIFNIAGQAAPVSSPSFPVRDRVFAANNMFYRLLVPQALKHPGWPFAGAVARFYKSSQHQNDETIERRLYRQVAAHEMGRRYFNYTHLMWVHDPLYYEAVDAQAPLPAELLPYRGNPDTANFVYTMRYANRKTQALIDSLLAKEGGRAVILLLGDHGKRQPLFSADTALFFQNLNAVYYPDGDYRALYDSMSCVNTMRALLNKSLGCGLPYLRDSSVFLQ